MGAIWWGTRGTCPPCLPAAFHWDVSHWDVSPVGRVPRVCRPPVHWDVSPVFAGRISLPAAFHLLLWITAASTLKTFCILHWFCSALTHWAYPASPCLFGLLSTKHCILITHASDKEFLIIHSHHNFYWYDWKTREACAQSFTLWQQVTIEITRWDHSIIACARHVYMVLVLRAQAVRGESHIQRNANGEVPTPYFKLHNHVHGRINFYRRQHAAARPQLVHPCVRW